MGIQAFAPTLALGILAARWLSIVPAIAWFALSVLAVLQLRAPARWLVLAFCLGAVSMRVTVARQESALSSHAAEVDDRVRDTLLGHIEGPVLDGPGKRQVLLVTKTSRVWLTVYGARPSLPELLPGQNVQVHARLKRPHGLRSHGGSDGTLRVLAKGADLLASTRAEDVEIVGESWSLWQWPTRLQRWAASAIQQGRKSDGAALIVALSTGDRSFVKEALSQSLRSVGISHLLAVSGMHLAVFTALVFWGITRFWYRLPVRQLLEPRSVAAAGSLLAAVFFAAATGGRPSTCRALLVAALVLGGVIFDRRIRVLNALAWAATVLLLWRPALLWDPGFQLSFSAAIFLTLAFSKGDTPLSLQEPHWSARWRRRVFDLVRASFWASFATAPFVLYHFGEFSYVGLISNLVAVPFTTVILLPLSIMSLFVSAIWSAVGQFLLDVCVAFADVLASACLTVHDWLPLVSWPALNVLELGLWAGLGVLMLPIGKTLCGRRRFLWLAGLACAFFISRLYWAPVAKAYSDELRITFVDMGQGDAAVVELPGGDVWLIDGGGRPFVSKNTLGDPKWLAEAPARQTLLPYLRHRRIDSIDLAIVSHPHPDHYVGLQAVARYLPIVELWSARDFHGAKGDYERWLKTLAARGTIVTQPSLHEARRSNGVALHALWPRYQGKAQNDPVLSINDNSLVVRVDYAGRRVLFTGDIERESETLLVANHAKELRADVVKVPHHGSATSSTESFVNATNPFVSVISCGRGNRFGFPDKDVQKRWHDLAQLVLRTDEVGSVTVVIKPDGQMEVETMTPI